ncbi:hypothetical protein CCY01nite_48100 [Chitinophaga cymbidii]|uniref:Uncharacterized protein n=1 Tax=Chitinophaga cymbidii TaxID=1096750 RepID=A0A512RS73_9BACT|nr:hypothetical protein CCY01nite_48100 [Chitinophaga cymbidii]
MVLKFFQQLEVRAAKNYLDVYREECSSKVVLPINPLKRLMFSVSFRTRGNKWQTDVNAHGFDKMQLPDTQGNPEQYRRPSSSTPYRKLSMQGTYRLKMLEFYAGCENSGNYRQPNPIGWNLVKKCPLKIFSMGAYEFTPWNQRCHFTATLSIHLISVLF